MPCHFTAQMTGRSGSSSQHRLNAQQQKQLSGSSSTQAALHTAPARHLLLLLLLYMWLRGVHLLGCHRLLLPLLLP
jgi:hypothetical protein